ncbi:MAG: response regulator transcription factor [Lachnospiraceae bacterium]|nr:response regulator transcription factor [Lachnospiraceae bacterium]
MIRIGICEDISEELEMQKKMIYEIMANLARNTELFCFQSGEDLLCEIDLTGNMDIIFLDVEMTGMNGIEVARTIRKRDTRAIIIFITCHNQYFQKMLEVQSFTVMKKPLDERRLAELIQYVLNTRFNFYDCYMFSYCKKHYRIPLVKIRFFQSDKRIIRISAILEKSINDEYVFYGKMEEVENEVNKADIRFLRIRKSFLVNPLFIMEYSANRVTLDNGIVLEIGRKYKEAVKKFYLLSLKGKTWE